VAAFALAAPSAAWAQACVGSPAGKGQKAIMAGVHFPPSAMTFDASLRANTTGPVSVGLQYGLTKSDDKNDPKLHVFGGDLAYELPVQSASVCPVAGVNYGRMSVSGGTLNNLTIPVGLALGADVSNTQGIQLIPHAIPQVYFTRQSETGFETVSDTNFGAILGLTVGFDQFFVLGDMSVTSVKNSKAVFGLGVGLTF
jgi:hypothetical protein